MAVALRAGTLRKLIWKGGYVVPYSVQVSASFPDKAKRAFVKFRSNEKPCPSQGVQDRTRDRDDSLLLGQHNDPDCSPHRDSQRSTAPPSQAVVQDDFAPGVGQSPCQHLALTRAQVPCGHRGGDFRHPRPQKPPLGLERNSGGVPSRSAQDLGGNRVEHNDGTVHRPEEIQLAGPTKDDEGRGVTGGRFSHDRARRLRTGKVTRRTGPAR